MIDLPERALVSQAANERYLEALTAVQDTTPLRQLVEPLCRAALEPVRQPNDPAESASAANVASEAAAVPRPEVPGAAVSAAAPRPKRPRRVRALNPLAAGDAALLEAVSRHEFLINGLRNRDLRSLLYQGPVEPAQRRRQSAAITPQLRLLRAHGLLQKVAKTHRYLVTESGRRVITALLAARNASADVLNHCAA